jgi:DNA-binding CsgD family transcriptional regulator
MEPSTDKPVLFADPTGFPDGVVVINDRCRLRESDGFRIVTACGIPLACFSASDRAGEAHAMVTLVDLGWARQWEVARAFGCDVRTVRRHQRRFEEGGLAALGRPPGFPRGQSRVPQVRQDAVNRWKAEGVSNREIGRRLGIHEKAVRKLAKRLGWREQQAAGQMTMPFETADPKLSASVEHPVSTTGSQARCPLNIAGQESSTGADPKLSASAEYQPAADAATTGFTPDAEEDERRVAADPKLSGSVSGQDPIAFSTDSNPANRAGDRLLARLGYLEDAPPLFGAATAIPGVGVLLAIPALVESGVLAVAREIYGSIGPAFYGLRTTLLTLLLMALSRVKSPEGLKERSPRHLGQVLGLDRAPEVKTLRRKIARLAAYGLAADFGRALAQRRVAAWEHAMGFLYVDGHVRAYHGGREIPKTHVTRLRISMPASTDYWVNDARGEPLFVVPTST